MMEATYNCADELMPVFDQSLGALICPACGCEWTHQGRVEVYDHVEDDPDTPSVCVETNGWTAEFSCQSDKNPSRRRQGVRILVECEQCEVSTPLVIYQHKGQTFIAWEAPR